MADSSLRHFDADPEKNNEGQLSDSGITDLKASEPLEENLHRQLKARHASMLAIGGAIGTGLIIGSGVGLARAGPVGLLIAFCYVGTLCYAMMAALGEMAAFLPHQRGFPGHASRFVSEGFGGMTGFCYYVRPSYSVPSPNANGLRGQLKYLIGTPTQYSACAVILNYWIPSTRVNNGVWVAIFILITAAIQFMPVRYFGEFEFWCSTFKVVVLTGLMIMSLALDLGGGPTHDRWGFRTWRDLPFSEYLLPGSIGKFCGFVSALITAVYSYTSTEMVGIAMGEIKNPRKNISRAVRGAFYRIVFLYCGSIFFIGLIVPANSPLLLTANKKSTNANASPFVVAINVAGVKVLPHIINAAALIFVVSAANSDVYVNSRSAYMLAADGNFPKIFMRTNRNGTPYVALSVSLLFSALAFTTVNTSALTIFKYFVSATTLFSTIAWMSIMFSHIRWMKACNVQGISRSDLPYTNRLNPYLSWWGLIGTFIISVTKGFDSIVLKFNATNFCVAYEVTFKQLLRRFHGWGKCVSNSFRCIHRRLTSTDRTVSPSLPKLHTFLKINDTSDFFSGKATSENQCPVVHSTRKVSVWGLQDLLIPFATEPICYKIEVEIAIKDLPAASQFPIENEDGITVEDICRTFQNWIQHQPLKENRLLVSETHPKVGWVNELLATKDDEDPEAPNNSLLIALLCKR
ncbi:hypothetical protein P7C73_g696, partial [Tremellales sp. Uapishka_1]